MTNKVLMFLLQYVMRAGDSPAAAQARELFEEVKAAEAPMAALESAIPHQGVQSPQPKSDEGLGSAAENTGAAQAEPFGSGLGGSGGTDHSEN